MLDEIKIYTADAVWKNILAGYGAVVVDSVDRAEINLDAMGLASRISPMELKAAILGAMDNQPIVRQVCGRDASVSPVQARIIALLYKSGGMSGAQLKQAMGYAPDVATHTIDTAIYQMRRMFGRDFIKNKNGVYVLGKL